MFPFSRRHPDHFGNGIHGTMSSQVNDIAEEARVRLVHAGEEAKKQFGDIEEIVKTWVKTRPGLTLGAALAAGVVIGWLIKRR
jgi:ElaB/YqjD/DUF883 family membrane-anchored ribosome-binding protein